MKFRFFSAANLLCKGALAAAVLSVIPGTTLQADTSLEAATRTLPAFELDMLDGASIDTAALDGKPWLINFWATWCGPCVEEIPAMNTAWEALEPAGFGMLAINIGEPAEAIEAFMEKVPIDFPVVLGSGATTMPNWQARALPTTLIVDRDGTIVQEAIGPREWDDPALIARLIEMTSD